MQYCTTLYTFYASLLYTSFNSIFFSFCLYTTEVKEVERPPSNPCVPSPCGPNSQCRIVGSSAACSCIENYIGRAPNCRPECTINAECPGNLQCQNERCRDPCIGSCGVHATCVTLEHVPHCNCEPGFTGDPFGGCYPKPEGRVATFEGGYRTCKQKV